jgi:hypothetical protein
MKPSSRVNRSQEQQPAGATVREVQGENVLIEYDEGGEGWWPAGSLTIVDSTDWNAYRLALRDPIYVNIVAKSFTSTADAIYGAANISAALNSFQYQGLYQDYLECILRIMEGSTFSQVEKADIAARLLALFNQCHLPPEFIAAFEAAIIPQSPPPE